MANFMDLPFELRIMVYKYLLTEEVQPTVYKYPRKILICNERSSFPEHIRKEAYSACLTSNNIIFNNSRSACLWLKRISLDFNTQEEQPLHLTFDLRHDCNRPVGRNSTRKADQKCFFHLLAQRSKLDLTLETSGRLIGAQYNSGALDLMHGFASASSTPAPAFDSMCGRHRNLNQHNYEFARAVAGRKAKAFQEMLEIFTLACPAGCEHLAAGGMRNSRLTIHLDVRGLRGDPTNCFYCFAMRN